MSEITRQRHEERMAERRRGAGARVVTQSFGFDLPLIVATPPEVRARRATEKRAALTVEEPAEAENVEPTAEEQQRRRSGRLSRGSSILSTPTPSGLDSMPDEDGSARKRRKLSSSPARSVSSRGSISVVIEPSSDILSNGQPTPGTGLTGAVPASAMANLSLKTPVTRSTSKSSLRRVTLASDASPMLSSPSPLPPRNSQQIVPSSVSPEPLKFIPEIPSDVGLASEPATPINHTVDESTLEISQQLAATGLRSAGRRASITPVPRGKRRRQPSSDKILTPEKPPTPEPEITEGHTGQEDIIREERPDTPPAEEEMVESKEPVEEAPIVEKPPGKRRGRKPKKKQPSVEVSANDLPTQAEEEEEAVLSDVEPEPLGEEANEQPEPVDEGGSEEELEEVDEDFEEVEDQPGEEEEEEEEPISQSALRTGQRKRTTNAPRRPRQPPKSRRRNENGELKETLDITVYRIPKQGDYNFKFPKHPNNIQLASQALQEHLEKQLRTLSLRKGEARDREEKTRVKIQEAVLTNFSSALENRLIGMASRADNIKMKSAELRRLQKEKASLRDELMRMRESREDVARQMDAVRKRHEEASEKAHKQQYINETLQQMGPVLDKSGADATKITPKEKILTTAHLDALIDTVTGDLCGSGEDTANMGGRKSILEQVREMNRFLEAAAEVLRSGR